MLALAEVQQGHDGGLLVLGGVSLKDLGDELLILGVELEGDVGVVVGCVSVLRAVEVSVFCAVIILNVKFLFCMAAIYLSTKCSGVKLTADRGSGRLWSDFDLPPGGYR